MDQGLVEQYAGGAWSIVPSPTPSGGAALTGVACADAGECWPWWRGQRGNVWWAAACRGVRRQRLGSGPLPHAAGRERQSQRCDLRDRRRLLAVGATDQPLQQATLIEHELGGVWTIVSSPNPSAPPPIHSTWTGALTRQPVAGGSAISWRSTICRMPPLR